MEQSAASPAFVCPVCGSHGVRQSGIRMLSGTKQVIIDGEARYFPQAQFDMVELMFRRAPNVVTYWALYEASVKGHDFETSIDTIKVRACAIRHKFKGTSLEGKMLTSWGVGYSMALPHPVLPTFEKVDAA